MRANDCCEIAIMPDRHLNFTVRVTLGDACCWENGFINPDVAHRRGIEMLLEMYAGTMRYEHAA
ncbi:MAG: hypothetical protein AB7E47_13540 [Desulfovibrionaceae bacterium]